MAPTLTTRLTSLKHLFDAEWLADRLQQPEPLSRWSRFWLRQMLIVLLTTRSLLREEVSLRAAALTYHTLLSLVPLLAVAFALFKAFGGLEALEGPLREWMVQNLAPGRDEEVGRWLEQFTERISAGAIAGVSVLFLFYTAVALLTNIESSLNEIWHTRPKRPFLVRFAIYWSLITLAPPLLGYSISLSARLQSSAFATAVVEWLPLGLGRLLLSGTSALAVCMAFVFVYMIVPSAKVRFGAALAGGVLAGLVWVAGKAGFVAVTAGSIKYSAIYGALGALPLLMLWLYISWLIVLFGASYAHTFQAVATPTTDVATAPTTEAFRELLGLRLAALAADDFRAGRPPPVAADLADRAGAPGAVTRQLLDVLTEHQVLVATEGDGEPGFVPGRDLQELTIEQVIAVLRERAGKSFALAESPELARIRTALETAEAASRAVLSRTSLRDLTTPEERPSSAPMGSDATPRGSSTVLDHS